MREVVDYLAENRDELLETFLHFHSKARPALLHWNWMLRSYTDKAIW